RARRHPALLQADLGRFDRDRDRRVRRPARCGARRLRPGPQTGLAAAAVPVGLIGSGHRAGGTVAAEPATARTIVFRFTAKISSTTARPGTSSSPNVSRRLIPVTTYER